MLQVPRTVMTRFEDCLAANNISEKFRGQYRKWLRFYLDFCAKYQHDANNLNSITAFQKKLLEKRQSERQRQQASHSVRLYLKSNQANTFNRSSSILPVSIDNEAEKTTTRASLKSFITNTSPLDTASSNLATSRNTLKRKPETAGGPIGGVGISYKCFGFMEHYLYASRSRSSSLQFGSD